jgi:hypothetical protein
VIIVQGRWKGNHRPIVGKVTQAGEKTKAVTALGKGGEKVTLNFSNSKMGT